jgi:hypothetical protein
MLKQRAELRRVLAMGVVFLTAGCNLDSLFGGGGNVQMVLSRDGGGALGNLIADSVLAHQSGDDDDHAVRGAFGFQAATVTLSSVLARTLNGELVNLDVDLPITVDVVKLESGRQIVLPDGDLPSGTYDQFVLVITAVQGLTNDGTRITIQPPGGGWTAVIPTCPLDITDAATTTVDVALNVRNSFIQLGGHSWSFQPRFRSLVDCNQNDDN